MDNGHEKHPEGILGTIDIFYMESKIRRQGYAVSNAEHDELIRSVAAPIRNHDGRVIASLGVLGIVQRIPSERVEEIAGQVMPAAGEISRLLGYLPPVSG